MPSLGVRSPCATAIRITLCNTVKRASWFNRDLRVDAEFFCISDKKQMVEQILTTFIHISLKKAKSKNDRIENLEKLIMFTAYEIEAG